LISNVTRFAHTDDFHVYARVNRLVTFLHTCRVARHFSSFVFSP
jgi:hypothetical protein